MVVYAFDVDETLEVSAGPIPVNRLRGLHDDGHVVGLCGNWARFTTQIPDWSQFVSFLGPMEMTKAAFLKQLMVYIPAQEYVLVGNIPGVSGVSDDIGAAQEAGWKFIRESDF